MRIRIVFLVGSVLATVGFIGCGRASVDGLDAPDELTLYSIDGRDFETHSVLKLCRPFRA